MSRLGEDNERLGRHLKGLSELPRRAPELAAWLLTGPMALERIVARRRQANKDAGMWDDELTAGMENTDYIVQHDRRGVLLDLGELARIGAIEWKPDGTVSLDEFFRPAVETFVRLQGMVRS